ncbi:MAG TPA: Ig-like domain-containing protein, partial [Polyangiaceae bacterium]|nr:Ig-like domain-containing protein [Polyangiaceae bacterium]
AVVITFSEALDKATITSQSVQIIDGDKLIDGELSYAGDKVTFTPAEPFALLAEYSVKVGTSITDVEGAALLAEYTASFTTRDGGWSVDDAASGAIYVLPDTLSVTQAGDVLVAWSVQGIPGAYCPTSARWFNGGAPKAATKVFTPQQGITECTQVAAAANAAGVGAVAWQEDYNKEYVEQYRESKWPANVGMAKTLFINSRLFGLGVAPSGAVLFLQHGIVSGTYARRTSETGTWLDGTPEIAGAREGLSSPRMAFDANGNGFAAWRAAKTGFDEVVVAALTASAGLQPASTLPGSPASSTDAGNERGAPAIAVDNDGGAMALWLREGAGSGALVSSRYTTAGGWEAPVGLSGTLTIANILDAPGLVFDGTNYVAAWTGKDGANHYVYSATFDMEFGEWSSYELRTSAPVLARMPGLGVDGRGNLLMTWLQSQNADQAAIMYARFDARAGEWSDATAVPGGIVKDDIIASQLPTPLGVGVSGHAAVIWGDENAQGALSKVRLASFY